MYLHVLILIVRAGIKAGFTYNQVNQVRQYVVQPPYLLVIIWLFLFQFSKSYF